MSSDNSNINTPDNSSDSSIDSEIYYTPIAAIHPLNMADINADVDNDDASNNPINAPMTLESLAQIMLNGFAELREANANLKLESDKNDERLNKMENKLDSLDLSMKYRSGLDNLTDVDALVVKNIKYQPIGESLPPLLGEAFNAWIIEIKPYSNGLIIHALSGDAVTEDTTHLVLVITNRTLESNVTDTTMMKGDVIRITSYSAEEANDPKSLALGDDPNIMKEFGLKVENTDDPDQSHDMLQVVRIASFFLLYRSTEAKIDLMNKEIKALKANQVVSNSSALQVQTNELLKAKHPTNQDRRSSLYLTKDSAQEEEKAKANPKRRNSNADLIAFKTKEGKVVDTVDDADKDPEEEDVFERLLKARDNFKGTRGQTRELSRGALIAISKAIEEVHDKSSVLMANGNDIPPVIMLKIQDKIKNVKYDDGSKISQTDIKFIYNGYIFGNNNFTSNVKVGNNAIIIKHPPNDEIVEGLKRKINVADVTIAMGSHYNKIADLKKVLNLYKNYDLNVTQVIVDHTLKSLIAKNENRQDAKGMRILGKMGVETSRNLSSLRGLINNTDNSNQVDLLSFEDIIDMWLYAIQPKSKEEFLNHLFDALIYNRGKELLPPNIHLDSVLYYKHIHNRLVSHIHDFVTLFKLITTYCNPNFMPPTVQAAPTVSSTVLVEGRRPPLLDLLSVFIKSFPTDGYLIKIWHNNIDDSFKQQLRNNSKDIIECMEELARVCQEDLNTSDNANKLNTKIQGSSKSAEVFYSTQASKYSSTAKPNGQSFVPLPRPANTSVGNRTPQSQSGPYGKPHNTGPISRYFPKTTTTPMPTQSLKAYQNEISDHPYYGTINSNVYYDEYDPYHDRREAAQSYFDQVDSVNRYDTSNPLHHMAYSNQSVFDNADPDTLLHAVNLVTSSRYPAFDKNQATQSHSKQNAPCFNFFDKGCTNPNCNYSHDRNMYNKHLEKQLADSKAILSRSQPHTVSHIAPSVLPTSDIETGRDGRDGREGGGGEQGGTSSTELDTGQHSAQVNTFAPSMLDDREKVNFFHASYANMDNEEQLHVLKHVKDMQQHKASNMMYQQGFVNGRLV